MNENNSVQFKYALQRKDFSLDVALDIPMRGITGIFGASGAGKTTLLRCIAGLEDAQAGELVVAGERWQDEKYSRATFDRNIGYVFQEPRLFRHLDVQANIEYGMRRSANNDGPDFAAIIELLGLENLLARRPDELSGGEAQRVAIARALLRGPKFVLMDEPLASLDAARKDEILPFLDRLHAQSQTPIIYVSHNLDEICRLCDFLIVLNAGKVAASGELQSVLVDLELPQLMGDEAGSVILGRVADYDASYGLTLVSFSGGQLWLPGRLGDAEQNLRLRIRASDISLCRERPTQTTVLNLLDVVVDDIQDTRAPTTLVRVAAGEERLIARITRRSQEELNLRPGDRVIAQVKAAAVRGLDNFAIE
ncbi:MAG: molybdenum ABC transporter ATP-binding protein [Woeseiaceae bacterium]